MSHIIIWFAGIVALYTEFGHHHFTELTKHLVEHHHFQPEIHHMSIAGICAECQ